MHSIVRSLSIALLAILPLACSGSGGGSAVATLDSGVNLSGTWQVTTTVTGVVGNCGNVSVGAVDTDTLTIQQTDGQIVLDQGTPEQLEDSLNVPNGTIARIIDSFVDGTETIQVDITVTFSSDGTSFSGTATFTSEDGCQITFDVSGSRASTGPAPVQAFLADISVTGGTSALLAGALPADSGGPSATPAGSTSVVNGGATNLGLSSSATFDTVAIAIGGVEGYWQVSLDNPTQAIQLLIQLGVDIPFAEFDCIYQIGLTGVWGPQIPVSVRRETAGTGALQVSLSWDTDADLDLYLVEPGGFVIYYGNETSPNGGMLDLDGNAGCSTSRSVENITYEGATPPAGTYTVRVNNWSGCSNPSSRWTVRINREGQAPILRSGTTTGAGFGGGQSAGEVIETFDV